MLPIPLRHLPLQRVFNMLPLFHSSSTFLSSAASLPFVDLHLSQWPRHRVGPFSQAGALKDESSSYIIAQLLLDMDSEAAKLIFKTF